MGTFIEIVEQGCWFLSAVHSEFLVKEKYAGKGKVAINGGSNGGQYSTFQDLRLHLGLRLFLTGLLVAACVNRAPEGTFGAAVAEVGVHDLLKVCSGFSCH